MMEFTQLVQGSSLLLDENHALLCDFDEMSCRIEDGVRVGLNDSILIMISMGGGPFQSEVALRINADFSLSSDGYIAQFQSEEYFFVRGIPLPEHPQALLKTLSNTLDIAKTLKQELSLHVAN